MNKSHNLAYELFERLLDRFGKRDGKVIVRAIMEEVGGLRVSIPSYDDLYRHQRDELIRKKFNGQNVEELSINFDLSKRHIRRIVTADE